MRAPGRKVLIPTASHIKTLNAARLAADVCDVPSLIIARTDAQAATLLTADIDERDQPFVTGERNRRGFYRVRNGIEPCIARGLAYAPYSICSGWRRPSPTSRWPARSPRASRTSTRTDARLQLLALVQLARASGRGDHRQFGKELAAMATGSSSSRWLASTR